MCQNFSGLISGVMPELWQPKPFGARKDLCAPFSLSSQWSHLIAKNALNYPKRQTLPSFNLWGHTKFVCQSQWSHLPSHYFPSHAQGNFSLSLSHSAHLLISVVTPSSPSFPESRSGYKGWSQSPKFEQGSNKWKSGT